MSGKTFGRFNDTDRPLTSKVKNVVNSVSSSVGDAPFC
jgi:hypothetical protein